MYQFNVKTMTCGGCGAAITRAINAADPDARVVTFPSIHRVDVDSWMSLTDLLQIFQNAGYPAETIRSNDNE